MDRSIRIQMLLVQYNLLAISVAINHTLALRKLSITNDIGIVLIEYHVVVIAFLSTAIDSASRVLDSNKSSITQQLTSRLFRTKHRRKLIIQVLTSYLTINMTWINGINRFLANSNQLFIYLIQMRFFQSILPINVISIIVRNIHIIKISNIIRNSYFFILFGKNIAKFLQILIIREHF